MESKLSRKEELICFLCCVLSLKLSHDSMDCSCASIAVPQIICIYTLSLCRNDLNSRSTVKITGDS